MREGFREGMMERRMERRDRMERGHDRRGGDRQDRDDGPHRL
jgi:hypothetical protein